MNDLLAVQISEALGLKFVMDSLTRLQHRVSELEDELAGRPKGIEPDRLHSTREAAELLGLRPGTLRHYRSAASRVNGPRWVRKITGNPNSDVLYLGADLVEWSTARPRFRNTCQEAAASRTDS